MHLFPAEIQDGLEEKIKANSSISYASALTPCSKESSISGLFSKSLASVKDSDLYYTQSILVSSSWNKNDDIFDKDEVWKARHSPEDKPTNLEHDEATIVGHIVSNWPITEDGILIDENTPVENLPEKYHILTGSVIYKAYTNPNLKDRTQALINDIENGTKYVSMECFFQGFDYGLINKVTGTYKVLPRDASTAHLTKFLRAYGGMGEHENYKIGRVLRNITFSGKGFVDRPANPDSIIFSKDNFKFLQNDNSEEKNSNILETGVNSSQSNINSENKTMSNENTEVVETVVADCTEATQAAETTIAALKTELDAVKAAHEILVAEHQEAINKLQAEENLKVEENNNLKAALTAAEEVIAGYKSQEKKMARKTTLMSYGFDSEKADVIIEKFDSLNDETFSNITEMLSAGMPPWLDKNKKKKDQEAKADEVETDITEVLENVEETSEVALTVGGEDESAIESTRAALVDFVCTRLGKKLNKGE